MEGITLKSSGIALKPTARTTNPNVGKLIEIRYKVDKDELEDMIRESADDNLDLNEDYTQCIVDGKVVELTEDEIEYIHDDFDETDSFKKIETDNDGNIFAIYEVTIDAEQFAECFEEDDY